MRSPPPPPAEIWPTQGWTFASPESQGIDSAALADAIDTIREKRLAIHSLFVERNGTAVLDAYFFPFRDHATHDLASVTKSVLSTLVGIAQGDGKLGTLDRPIAAFLPELANSDPVKARITLADLLSMTSGIDCRTAPGENLLDEMDASSDGPTFLFDRPQVAEPGTIFVYCGGGMQIVSAALTRAAGESASALARRELFAPLGIGQAAWPSDPRGLSHGFAGLELQPRDAAKLGYLWLHHGLWEGRQIVPADFLATALAPHATVQPGIQYGYGMWLYPSHTPYDFEANGRGGQRITIVPSESLVEVVTAGGANADVIARLLAKAVRANVPLPANDAGEARLAQAVARAALPPAASVPPVVPDLAKVLAGTTWRLDANPLGLRTLALAFDPPSVHFTFKDGTSGDHPFGLDGVPRLSDDPASGHPVALLGRWTRDAFDLDVDEVARINAYTFHLAPAPGGLRIRLTERSGLVDANFGAVAELQTDRQ